MDAVRTRFYLFGILTVLQLCLAGAGADDIDVNYEYQICGNTGTYTNDPAYRDNLNKLLPSLSDRVNEYGFYNGSVGDGPERASAVVLCRGDVEMGACRGCVSDSSRRIQAACPTTKEAFRWYNICSIYYTDESVLGSSSSLMRTSDNNITQGVQYSSIVLQHPPQFNQSLTSLVRDLTSRAARGGSDLKFAVDSAAGPDGETIYAYVQCIPELSAPDCTRCLTTAYGNWSASGGNDRIGARVLKPACFFRYEISPFFSIGRLINESQSLRPPPPPPSGNNKLSTWKIILTAVAASFGLVIICSVVILRQRHKQNAKNHHLRSYSERVDETSSVDEISSGESVQYEFAAIKKATNNFSEENKIGSGGFGDVYKGKLESGVEVAVKRLSQNSRQGNTEFITEVTLMARLQHRNLVRLYGFCQQGKEMILVYEFVRNGSLDTILFDPVKRRYLDWERRFKIIESIARGLVYLHEDSRLRIIHRDLKASNILLDADLNPKIADFGTAKLFALDETRGSTSRIVGTYGYMAPEYAYHGQFSIRSDVYSFGVLLLEIISGQRHSQNQDSVINLLSFVWTEWRNGTAAANVIDPILRDASASVHEIAKCIHVGLLCVQENVENRPTMSVVVQMLSNMSASLPMPSRPGFVIHSSDNFISSLEASKLLSRNEMSYTEPYPR